MPLDSLPSVPLPAFLQPHRDRLDPLTGETSTSPSDPETEPEHPQQSPPDDAPPPPIESSPARPAAGRTRTSATDPGAAGKALTGLLVIAAGLLGAALARSGRRLRQPTPRQAEDVAVPLGAILARHLPTDVIGPDLADATAAAAALHSYVLDESGPLIATIPAATVAYPEES